MRTAVVYNFLLEATLMASIAILLMIPICALLRKKLGSRTLCFGWLLVAIRLLCPLSLPNPIIHEIRSDFAPDAAIRPIAGQIKVRLSDLISDTAILVNRAFGRKSDLAMSMDQLVESSYNGMLSINLMKIYVAGLLIVLLWFILSNVRFRRKLVADRIEPVSGKLWEEYVALCEENHVKPLPVWYADPLPSACLVGVFRPYIALPLTAKPQEALQVLRHEVCHYKGHDHWWGVVRLACCALHWFNPLVWLAAHMSRTDLELACDDRVTEKLDESEKRAYAGVLVLAAGGRDLPGVSVLSTGMSMTGRKLKKRVSAIISGHHISHGLVLAFVMFSAMALVGAFATAEYFPKPRLLSVNEEVRQREVAVSSSSEEDAADAIAYAKEIWAHPCVQADVENLDWQMHVVNDHIEVSACQPDGAAALHMAFLKDGRLIYLCNLASGDREAFVSDQPHYANKPHVMKEMALQAADAAMALSPKLNVNTAHLSEGDESNIADARFLHFYDTRTTKGGEISWGIRLQVEPEVRVTYLIDHQYFSSEDADRLEPGNG